ncbi:MULTISPECIES: hypothetical protein [Alcanivorax]|uniref:hypothetical protein n=1 Tax=Alcanivorax TaxID=59753 RepID=UPI0025C1CA20|nr:MULTISPECIES: hypothetical protein [Alcanivorax]MCK5885548.1 hypothetical protein [Alcanivorax sp.]
MLKKLSVFFLALCSPALSCAGLLVVVAESSPLAEMDRHEVRQLYMDNASRFDGHAVTVLDMPEGSQQRERFYQGATGKSASQLKSYWARMIFTGQGMPPRQVKNVRDMVQQVKQNPRAVGYVQEADMQEGLRVLLRLP